MEKMEIWGSGTWATKKCFLVQLSCVTWKNPVVMTEKKKILGQLPRNTYIEKGYDVKAGTRYNFYCCNIENGSCCSSLNIFFKTLFPIIDLCLILLKYNL